MALTSRSVSLPSIQASSMTTMTTFTTFQTASRRNGLVAHSLGVGHGPSPIAFDPCGYGMGCLQRARYSSLCFRPGATTVTTP